uniref:Uncharacterized protein n=1 Tax=Quercus lobata TaxID=97700 RepID=A0A7N2MZS2_QUELO
MDGEVAGAKVKMMIREDNTTSVHAITLRVTRSLITNVLLIWSIHYGLELATQTKEYIGCEWDFHVGILTMVLGYVLLFVKLHNLLAISAEQLLQQAEENGTPQDMHQELAGKWQQQEEENGTHQGSNLKADIYICFVCKE